ncbi:MAG: c-type cytochrome [Blastocatellia bacterium]
MRVCARNGRLLFSLFSFLAFFASCSSQSKGDPQLLTDRERDGLIGDVKAVLTEDVVLMEQGGQWNENQQASSTAIYDAAGKRMLQTPFRVSLTGGHAITQHESLFDPAQKNRQVKENRSGAPETMNAGYWLKSYDGKGNLIERTLHLASHAPVSQEIITYEYDARGNWIKRAVKKTLAQAEQPSPEFTESSYRHVVYFDSVGGTSAQSLSELVPASAKELRSPIPAMQETTDAGRGLFLQKCSACHGENGKAQTEFAASMPTKPADLTSPQISALTEGEIYSLVNDGIKTRGMPAFKGRISDNAIWQMVLFVRQLNSAEDKPALAVKALPSPRSASNAEPERRYTLKGKIVSVERELKQVMVEHEEVKEYMEAMTMPFPMKDEKMLGRLKKDDKIQATLVVGIGFWRLENVVIK